MTASMILVPRSEAVADFPDVVVIDTCVLISNVLRRLLLRLAREGCFCPASPGVRLVVASNP